MLHLLVLGKINRTFTYLLLFLLAAEDGSRDGSIELIFDFWWVLCAYSHLAIGIRAAYLPTIISRQGKTVDTSLRVTITQS